VEINVNEMKEFGTENLSLNCFKSFPTDIQILIQAVEVEFSS